MPCLAPRAAFLMVLVFWKPLHFFQPAAQHLQICLSSHCLLSLSDAALFFITSQTVETIQIAIHQWMDKRNVDLSINLTTTQQWNETSYKEQSTIRYETIWMESSSDHAACGVLVLWLVQLLEGYGWDAEGSWGSRGWAAGEAARQRPLGLSGRHRHSRGGRGGKTPAPSVPARARLARLGAGPAYALRCSGTRWRARQAVPSVMVVRSQKGVRTVRCCRPLSRPGKCGGCGGGGGSGRGCCPGTASEGFPRSLQEAFRARGRCPSGAVGRLREAWGVGWVRGPRPLGLRPAGQELRRGLCERGEPGTGGPRAGRLSARRPPCGPDGRNRTVLGRLWVPNRGSLASGSVLVPLIVDAARTRDPPEEPEVWRFAIAFASRFPTFRLDEADNAQTFFQLKVGGGGIRSSGFGCGLCRVLTTVVTQITLENAHKRGHAGPDGEPSQPLSKLVAFAAFEDTEAQPGSTPPPLLTR